MIHKIEWAAEKSSSLDLNPFVFCSSSLQFPLLLSSLSLFTAAMSYDLIISKGFCSISIYLKATSQVHSYYAWDWETEEGAEAQANELCIL
jgi:hypothetical protein